MRWTSHDSPMT